MIFLISYAALMTTLWIIAMWDCRMWKRLYYGSLAISRSYNDMHSDLLLERARLEDVVATQSILLEAYACARELSDETKEEMPAQNSREMRIEE